MKRLLLLLLFFSSAFSSATLEVTSVDYSYIYSNSLSHITFNLENTGDEIAVLTNTTMTGFPSYIVYFSPESIPVGVEAEVIFEVSTPCEARGNNYVFVGNFTYEDSADTWIANSTFQTILVASPLSLEITEPADTDSSFGIQTSDIRKLLYTVSNNGLSELSFNISITYDDSIFSKVITPLREYSTSLIQEEVFSLQPSEDIVFSHSLIPVLSGSTGNYLVILTDENCDFNKEIINLEYTIFSSNQGPVFNIIVADEMNIIILIMGLLLTSFILIKKFK